MRDVVIALATIGDRDNAIKYAELLQEDRYRSEALQAIVMALVTDCVNRRKSRAGFIAERKFKVAEEVARHAVRVLNKSGHQVYLAEALITHGTALARLGKNKQAVVTLERAFAIAQEAGALNQAGMAALTIIEELNEAATETLSFAFDRASEWLPSPKSDELGPRLNAAAPEKEGLGALTMIEELEGLSRETLLSAYQRASIGMAEIRNRKLQWRLIDAAKKVMASFWGELDSDRALERLPARPASYEGALIKQFPTYSHASISETVSLAHSDSVLGTCIIELRYKALFKKRTKVRRRSRKNDTGSFDRRHIQ